MWRESTALLLLVLVLHCNPGWARQCGFPGRPRNGSSVTAGVVSRPGDVVLYSCLPRFTLFGDEERVCLDSGIWASRQPLCELNLALNRTAQLSATLWNYRASLAVDGNPDTCSFTPRTTEQRWWQVDLHSDQQVGSVALVINKDSYQEFTIFVVQLLSKIQALYKPCATFKGRFQHPRILFACNDGLGHMGRYVYIRDDRRDQDYFGLCEVEAFAYRDDIACGDPEVPVAGNVSLSPDGTALYSCEIGYRLLAESNRTCERDGHWTAHAPQCEEIQCEHPGKTAFGFPDVGNLKGRFPYDTQVTYKCQPGYVIWGNATRVCTETGLWTGAVPLCKPITCGYPQTYPHSEVELLNQSTLWNSMAVYSCKIGYAFQPGTTQVSTKCLSNGSWEKINITCVPSGKRNPPVKLTGNEYDQHTDDEHEDDDSGVTVGTSGIISIGIFCSLLIILLAVLGIFLAKRFQSKKAAHQAASKSSTNDLIIGGAKDGIYDDVGVPVVSTVVKGQPQCPPPGTGDKGDQGSNVMPYFTRRPEGNHYDTLQSLPSISSSNNSKMLPDNVPDCAFMHLQREGGIIQDDSYMPVSQDIGYETVAIRTGSEYETIRHLQGLQPLNVDSTYEIVQPNGVAGTAKKVKGKAPLRAIPMALKYFLHSPSKQTVAESELYNDAVPAEILALYAQVDKTKKRNYRPDISSPEGNYLQSQGDNECECSQHPISDIVRFTQQCSSPVMWSGNSKDCADTFRETSTFSRPLPPPPPPAPTVRFLHTIPQESELHTQAIECNQL